MYYIKSNEAELIFAIFIMYCVFVIIYFNQYYWLQTENVEKFVHARKCLVNQIHRCKNFCTSDILKVLIEIENN